MHRSYMPQYNPVVIDGTPYVTLGYTAGDVIAGSLLGFGAGVFCACRNTQAKILV
jgi:hypothetical protein